MEFSLVICLQCAMAFLCGSGIPLLMWLHSKSDAETVREYLNLSYQREESWRKESAEWMRRALNAESAIKKAAKALVDGN